MRGGWFGGPTPTWRMRSDCGRLNFFVRFFTIERLARGVTICARARQVSPPQRGAQHSCLRCRAGPGWGRGGGAGGGGAMPCPSATALPQGGGEGRRGRSGRRQEDAAWRERSAWGYAAGARW